jgi:hypothetical protein
LRLIIDIQQQASVALGLPEDLNLMTGQRKTAAACPKSATFGPTYLKISKHAHGELKWNST